MRSEHPHDDNPPVACTLTAGQIRCQADQLLPGLVARARTRRWTLDGLHLSFAPTSDSLAAIAETIDRERVCCAFLAFTLTVPMSGMDFTVEVSGPPRTREFLATLDIVLEEV